MVLGICSVGVVVGVCEGVDKIICSDSNVRWYELKVEIACSTGSSIVKELFGMGPVNFG